jgi:spermidine synthase
MQRYLPIFQVCLTILFVELLMIRWISTEVSIFAYLQNSILIACFLGLGVGLIEPKPGDQLTRLLRPLLVLTAFLSIPQSQHYARTASSVLGGFHDFTVWNDTGAERFTQVVVALLVTLFILGCCWAIMVQLGAELGRLLGQAQNRIAAYSADMLGSMAGVWLFTVLAYLSLPPQAWFLVLAVVLFSYPAFRKPIPGLGCLLMLGLVSISAIQGAPRQTTWTPYQKLEFKPLPDGEWVVVVNNSGFQQIQNNASELSKPRPERLVHQYNLPARLAGNPQRALIVGAGTGNDVAGMLRNSQAHIEAVDIDPVLLRFGSDIHPEKPYQSARVHVTVNDARASIQSMPPGSFDVIVFGLLDSHTTPNLSNARLDNFVYTRESIQAAARLLKPHGVLVLLFHAQREYIGSRLYNTVKSVFQQEPMVFMVPKTEWGWGGMAFVVGSTATVNQSLASDPLLLQFIEANAMKGANPDVISTTDSWPYLYIEKPSIPSLFWILGAMFLSLWVASSRLRYGRILGPDLRHGEELYLMLLGASFSLVQVFSICKASIVFGSTWLVNSAAISGILVMILIANLLLPVVKLSRTKVTLLLSLSCFGLAFLPMSKLLSLPPLLRFAVAAALSGLPMVASGILFGRAFKVSPNPGRALGANLFGAMLGGALQLITFQWGIPSLMVLAGLIYLASGLVRLQDP